MTTPWNGLPDQPERSGTFHILRHKKNRSLVKMRYIFWGGSRYLKANGHWHEAAEVAKLFDYVTPVISSSELAQVREGWERAITACKQSKIPDFSMPEQWHNNGVDSCISAIRALTDDEGEKS